MSQKPSDEFVAIPIVLGIIGVVALVLFAATEGPWAWILLGIGLLILAALARAARSVWVGALVLAILAAVAQSGLAAGGEDNKWVGGLHALDGMIILLLAGWLTGMGHRREAARRRAT